MGFWNDNLVRWIETACLMEVMTPKPGNVFPGQSFADCGVEDFVRSAKAIALPLARVSELGIGAAVLEAVQQSRRVAGANTHLGVILLIAPMAAVPPEESLAAGIRAALAGLTMEDTRLVYEAIRIARPGGLQTVAAQDVSQTPTIPLTDCMRLAADHDLIARQYVSDFEDVLTMARTGYREARIRTLCQRDQISLVALRLLACEGDSLIARKCGRAMSDLVSDKAASIVASGWPATPESRALWAALNAYLTEEGNQRNPGTTADMVAASLFAALREGCVTPHGGWWQFSENSK